MKSSQISQDEEKSIKISSYQRQETLPENSSIRNYAITRVTSLKPPMAKVANPFKLLAMLNKQQWAFFLVSFLAWSWDSFDFFTVSLTVDDLAETFQKSTTDITWGITLVLMLRSAGAALFGLAADRYGRKWPFIAALFLFIILELATGFCKTYKQFLAIRALLGIAMGGLYGNAAVTALEDCPTEARGLVAGLMQQGYAFGYLLATAFARALVDTTTHGWRPYFWFSACPPVFIIIFRLCLPETKAFQTQQTRNGEQEHPARMFLSEGRVALRSHWLVFVYLVLLSSGLNFMSHGTQDLYPTMLENERGFSATAVTVTQVVANLGAMAGGSTTGYFSQIFGRRFSMLVVCVVGGTVLYPYTYVKTEAVTAVAFFVQFCVQGAWSVMPSYMMDLAPASFQTFVVGSAYQFGSLASSASSTIEATLGEHYPLAPLVKADGTVVDRYDYGKVICIFMGAIYAYTVLLIIVGPEKRGQNTDAEFDADMDEMIHANGRH
ncbi:uncharacterized protein N7484_001164 [Penicillium longicatenatum]|uniref:uncharacterized protein n=1 Tax=Penicillium longicatenatum TaxID=1561947 RepID=UPI002547DC8E|nr:uncharacterized protein N7484_001164 [Penicillium longicatenatum]KAJ5657515.1 hypothetical protein N7484_001164 [Penicillium longicatenatum]